ncbi:MAG: ubiquinol-cytochrome c reductase iron-sulfur subunit [Anaerolineae bacterium]|nr:MAG: ubiquinol-cytochrome c reductase iron-sulfur subunit [Anaerolineae bacterium]
MSEATASNEQVSAQSDSLAVNRREFLNLAWLASLGFLTLQVGGYTLVFAYPRFKEGEFGGIFTYGPVANLPEVNASPENFPKVKFWISHTDVGIVALYKVCVHLGCIYGWSDQEFKFICPCHGSQYEYDGTYRQGPAPRSLDQFVIQIVDENGNELARTPDSGGPVALPDNPNAVVRIDTGAKIIGENHA